MLKQSVAPFPDTACIATINDHMQSAVRAQRINLLYCTRQVKIWNTRLRLMQLVEAAKDLFEHGPAKPPAEHGLDEVNTVPNCELIAMCFF